MLTGEIKHKHEPQRLEKDRKGKSAPQAASGSFYISKPARKCSARTFRFQISELQKEIAPRLKRIRLTKYTLLSSTYVGCLMREGQIAEFRAMD